MTTSPKELFDQFLTLGHLKVFITPKPSLKRTWATPQEQAAVKTVAPDSTVSGLIKS
ncbi:MAG: hypothetical protein HYR56_05220 [Acidobacteria bacterium]|nr:hypothetical protein [Acidobacteriota bacterium]